MAVVYPAFPQTWMPITQPGYWSSIASSADGSKLVAVTRYGNTGQIYTSTNSGSAWVQQTNAPDMAWYCVASSADGTKLAAGPESGPIYVSTNCGVTWTQTISSNTFWTSIASSADGTKLVAEQGHPLLGPIDTSDDSGATWSTNNNAPSLFWEGIASSADGTKLVAVATTGQIYTSINSGASWNEQIAPANFWSSVASSADGARLVAVYFGGGIYTSTNSGGAWAMTRAPSAYWNSVASSADGSKLVAVADGNAGLGLIMTSTNSGITWITNTSPYLDWSSVASSADGNSLVATPYGDPIYGLRTVPSPQLSLVSSSKKLVISWIIPSTNFVLQQGSNLVSWSDITNIPTLNLTNLQNQIGFSPSNGSSFYRLATP